MRGLFVIALGFMSLVAFACLQPASAAAAKCVPVNCHVYHGTHGPVTTCDSGVRQRLKASGRRSPFSSRRIKE
jgi:hypothetical protein